MLHIRLICVGRLGERFWEQAVQEYAKRLRAYCKLEVVEVPEYTQGDPATALRREAAWITSKIPAGARVVAFCVEGTQRTSEQFADWLNRSTLSGMSRLCLLIGGSYGLDESLKQSATLRLSLSSMTFPHHLARVMVLEQLYRAMNLLSGGKYHK